MSDARHTDSNYAHIYSTRNNLFCCETKSENENRRLHSHENSDNNDDDEEDEDLIEYDFAINEFRLPDMAITEEYFK